MAKIQSIRGMNDILPSDIALWQYVESTVADVLAQYAYREIRFPIVESTELFCRSIGEVTDIVEKEMYTFLDRNEESVTLRPEGTASCVRACEQHGMLFNQVQRLWYTGPMFRYERPQKGRLRQFHQIGVEAFGMLGPDIDVELIALTARLWRVFGIENQLSLELNSIGSAADRQRYKQDLVAYLTAIKEQLDEDSQRRLHTNPLRILDSKSKQTQALLNDAPKLSNYLDTESKEHFSQLCAQLDTLGIPFEVNERLVRGLDYYGKTVFEWTSRHLGAQSTVCAGGRYDSLVEQLGGKPCPAVGFAMGMERLCLLLQELDCVPAEVNAPPADVYVVIAGELAQQAAGSLVEQLRDLLPTKNVMKNCGAGSFKSQMKKADKSGAQWAIIIGDDEISNNNVVVKALRDMSFEQQAVVLRDAAGIIAGRH